MTNILKIQQKECKSLVFNRLRAIWPKGYQRVSLGKNHQKGECLKQEMRNSCLPTEFEPAVFGLPVHFSTT